MKRALILAIAFGSAYPAVAQEADLSEMSVSNLRPEVQRRYNESLAATQSPDVLTSLSSTYTWASEAKVQCGIAMGFLKSSIRDRDSLSKCQRFHAMITRPQPVAPVSMPEPPAPRRNTACDTPFSATVFFDWNSAVPASDASQTIEFILTNKNVCNWTSYNVVGHTDRSGSDSYNDALSIRRATAIAGMMSNSGIDGSSIKTSGRGEAEPKVDTPDGERNPTNRRVEISANK